MSGFTTGLNCAFSGLRLITLPGIRLYVLVPLLLNTLIFAAVIVYGVNGLDDLIHWVSEQWTWLDWVAWLLWPVFIVISLVVVFFCFALLANLIAAPFNGFLSAAVEYQLTGSRPPEAATLGGLPGEIMAVMGSEARKFVYFFVRALPLLLIFIIPFVQAAAPVIWFLFAAWMMAVEYLDYPMGNRGMLFPDIRRELLRRRTLSLGFGVGILFLTMIPVLNFVAMPAGVAGATRLYVERFRPAITA
jgi:CysZ protein